MYIWSCGTLGGIETILLVTAVPFRVHFTVHFKEPLNQTAWSVQAFHSLAALEAQGKGLNEVLMGLSASMSGECVQSTFPGKKGATTGDSEPLIPTPVIT